MSDTPKIGTNLPDSCGYWPHNIWVLALFFALFLLLSACAYATRNTGRVRWLRPFAALTTNPPSYERRDSWLLNSVNAQADGKQFRIGALWPSLKPEAKPLNVSNWTLPPNISVIGSLWQFLVWWPELSLKFNIDQESRCPTTIPNSQNAHVPRCAETANDPGAFSVHYCLSAEHSGIRAFLRLCDLRSELPCVRLVLLLNGRESSFGSPSVVTRDKNINSGEYRHYFFKSSHRAFLGMVLLLFGFVISLKSAALRERNRKIGSVLYAVLSVFSASTGMLILLSIRHM